MPEILQYDFMIRALIAGALIGLIAPLIGVFLVVRRYALMADTLAHVSLAGIAASMFLKTPPVFTALAVSLLAALGIEHFRTAKIAITESVLGLFLWGSLAFAVIVMSLTQGLNANITSLLFGSVTTVSSGDIITTAVLSTIVITVIACLYKELFFTTIDRETALVQGVRVNLVDATLMIVTAVTITLAMKIVGVLLIGALMVIPVAAAMQWARSFRETLQWAMAFSFVSVISGIVMSFYLNLPAGGATVAVAIAMLVCSAWGSKRLRSHRH